MIPLLCSVDTNLNPHPRISPFLPTHMDYLPNSATGSQLLPLPSFYGPETPLSIHHLHWGENHSAVTKGVLEKKYQLSRAGNGHVEQLSLALTPALGPGELRRSTRHYDHLP